MSRTLLPPLMAVLLLVLSTAVIDVESLKWSQPTYNMLYSIRNAFPTLQSNWTGDGYCTWDGITCEDDGVHVDLRDRGLEGNLWMAISDAGSIQVAALDLSDNIGIRGTFQEDLYKLSTLRVLNLSYTSLKGSLPDKWRYMMGIEQLYIHHTAACGSLPVWTGMDMPNLRYADLSHKNMQSSLQCSLHTFKNLELLSIAKEVFFL